ncbi:SGS domain-containing protein [Chytridium lagenaria]|nr:SGS domain-containing protein [Chytridium lagenaria]
MQSITILALLLAFVAIFTNARPSGPNVPRCRDERVFAAADSYLAAYPCVLTAFKSSFTTTNSCRACDVSVLASTLGPSIAVCPLSERTILQAKLVELKAVLDQAFQLAFVDEDYDLSLTLFTPITHSKLSNPLDALNDATAAIMLAAGNTDIAAKANMRKGVALFELKRFEEALEANVLLNRFVVKAETVPPQTIAPAAPYLPPAKIRHEWFQNENFVTVSVFIKKHQKGTRQHRLCPKSLSVTVKLPTGSDFTLDLDPLAHAIIEIKLKKENVGVMWGTLEGEDEPILRTMQAAGEPTYPSSSKKQIYRNADDNTRRAMMKSFVESNGTTLSTNWEEVGKGKVEVNPPEGMVAKKFDL